MSATHIENSGGHSPADPAAARPERDETRVILVGRTGLDAKIRLDPALLRIPVKTALEAVGELSNPIDESAASRAVVVVAPDADPAHGRGGERGLSDFIRSLRRVDPGVRVLRVAPNGEAPRGASPEPYDGLVSANEPIETLRAAICGEPEPASTSPPAALTQAPPSGRAVESLVEFMLEGQPAGATGDEALVARLMRGRDVLGPALDLIRQRLGGRPVRYVSSDAPGAGGAAAVGSDVAWRSHRFGWLVADGVPAERLGPHAQWLAGWLALAEQQSQLRHEAFTDPLTGAWNRRYFERFLAAALRHAQRDRRHLSVLVFDIDDFKRFNDRYGHAAGDAILVEAVRLLNSVIRPTDKVCRIGGDEFAVIFHEPTGPRQPTSRHPDSIYAIAKRFQQQVNAHKFPKLAHEAPGTLTISGGLATFPWDGRSAAELLSRADEAALQGKRDGKNSITLGPGAARAYNGEHS